MTQILFNSTVGPIKYGGITGQLLWRIFKRNTKNKKHHAAFVKNPLKNQIPKMYCCHTQNVLLSCTHDLCAIIHNYWCCCCFVCFLLTCFPSLHLHGLAEPAAASGRACSDLEDIVSPRLQAWHPRTSAFWLQCGIALLFFILEGGKTLQIHCHVKWRVIWDFIITENTLYLCTISSPRVTKLCLL